MNDIRKWDFFIAHAEPDQAAAERLYDLLTERARTFLGSKTNFRLIDRRCIGNHTINFFLKLLHSNHNIGNNFRRAC